MGGGSHGHCHHVLGSCVCSESYVVQAVLDPMYISSSIRQIRQVKFR
jgi:hypothetical protein